MNAGLRWVPLMCVAFSVRPAMASEAWQRIEKTGEIRWCGDTTGGAPYVFPDEKNPKRIIGFEVDLMDAVARELGKRARLVVVPWEQLVPALNRGDCDVVVNGLEITEDRRKVIDFSIPYYVFTELITVQRGERRFQTLADLRTHRVGTLAASLAESMLKEDPQITVVPYPSGVEAYRDLEVGRVDAVLMDDMIAIWYAGPNPKLENIPRPIGESLYGAGIRKDSPHLKEKFNDTLRTLVEKGDLERIYKAWKLWTPAQKRLRKLSQAGWEGRLGGKPWTAFIPLLLKGALVTILISVLAMGIAVLGGSALCYGRLFGVGPLRWLCNGLIELIRGTPLLIQLYLLYYGLPNIGIELNAFVAAVLGMGINYAAYEAEIYRAAYHAVPRGQMDAARSLGMTRNQSLRYVLIPQSIRIALPPSTNDFIALFKDTSLVSIITVTELTKAYSTAATTTYRFLELGLATAFLYFAMSFPLSLWSRRLEKRSHATLH